MPRQFPKLLVATESPPNASGGGGTIERQMLKGWPVERLFWWSCFPDDDPRFGQRVAGHRVAKFPPKLYPRRRFRVPKVWFLRHIWSRWATWHFRQTLARFKPDVVWVIPTNWSIPPLVKALLPSGVPFHVSVHDYADCHVGIKSFGPAQAWQLQAQMELLYARANSRDGIFYPMIEDMHARTGRDAVGPIHAGLEKEDFAYLEARPAFPDGPLRVAYAGTISAENDFALFAEALGAVRPQLARPVFLEIFSSHSYRDCPWFDATWMNERGNLAEPQFSAELKKCHWGFAMLPLTEDKGSNRFSLPTKWVSYLAAGLPVFALGHPESSLIRLARQYRVGVWADSDAPEILLAKAREAFSTANPWDVFGPEICRCARQEFDAMHIRQTLHECFFTAARTKPT